MHVEIFQAVLAMYGRLLCQQFVQTITLSLEQIVSKRIEARK